MQTLTFVGWMLAVSLGYMTLVWMLSLVLRNASIVDSFWAPGFVILAAVGPFLAGTPTWRDLLVLAIVAIWAVRLAAHVTIRNWGKGEDWRYKKWRDEAGAKFWWTSYFKVFALQGILLVVVAAPILAVAASRGPTRVTWGDIAGTIIWLAGLSFEAIADLQLARFKHDAASRGRVMDRGLWRTSRHPNYFGEAVVWWGIFLIALATPHGYWSAIGPIAITFLLVRVSGVRMLEKGLLERKPDYADYVRRTGSFVPRMPRRRP
jgi:steroid 5-alpha reductase family enzyme